MRKHAAFVMSLQNTAETNPLVSVHIVRLTVFSDNRSRRGSMRDIMRSRPASRGITVAHVGLLPGSMHAYTHDSGNIEDKIHSHGLGGGETGTSAMSTPV